MVTSVALGRVKSDTAGGFIWGEGVERRVHVCDFQMGLLLAENGWKGGNVRRPFLLLSETKQSLGGLSWTAISLYLYHLSLY